MFEEIRCYLMERWARNRSKMIELEAGAVLPNIKKKLFKERERSRFWMCRVSGDMLFEVYNRNQTSEQYTVNLNAKTCSCRRWMLSGIPCCHAITCYMDRKLDPNDYIPHFYRKEAYVSCYEPLIHPTNGQNLWETTPYPDILPPPMRKMPGRPKKSRNKGADEKAKGANEKAKGADEKARDPSLVTRKGKANNCSICKQVGHNKRSCKSNVTQAATSQNATQAAPQVAIQAATSSNVTQTANQPASQSNNVKKHAMSSRTNKSKSNASVSQTFPTDKSATDTSSTQPTPNATKRTSALFKDMLATKTTVRPKMQPRKPSS